ncbi:GNAT family N-acetyltransferase [Morganella morganii]|uniref:GNAT family N-acetyltransferase n=1 Tax=Morganella morganii TaxID=582 RepID=UPI001C441F97|nr:GNAT family N-acetyltransferase [Morganella morganii]QXO71180.1 GNAT family N-acetyltransferase [Morganella morganii]
MRISFFYLTEAAEAAQKGAVIPGNVRMLTEADRDIFAQFCARNNDEDADIAGVELTHPRVTGVFAEGRLVAAASACQWEDSLLQDIGVLTDPRYRRQGFARQALLALNRVILEAGLKPQYRCQTDNISSLILAQQSGFTPFAQWDFLLSEEEE